ncbi:MAG: hypothetical protein BroJett030_12290 [Alphaproteobacteria bacterium]|nr:MAG: hypothetical protein BroJett030_12290 [Alphaproteobacteria bacterium]
MWFSANTGVVAFIIGLPGARFLPGAARQAMEEWTCQIDAGLDQASVRGLVNVGIVRMQVDRAGAVLSTVAKAAPDEDGRPDMRSPS